MKFLDSEGAVCDTADLERAVVVPIVEDPRERALRKHAIPALRDAAMKPCHRSNCGELCLCMRCHARKALETLDPGWTP